MSYVHGPRRVWSTPKLRWIFWNLNIICAYWINIIFTTAGYRALRVSTWYWLYTHIDPLHCSSLGRFRDCIINPHRPAQINTHTHQLHYPAHRYNLLPEGRNLGLLMTPHRYTQCTPPPLHPTALTSFSIAATLPLLYSLLDPQLHLFSVPKKQPRWLSAAA